MGISDGKSDGRRKKGIDFYALTPLPACLAVVLVELAAPSVVTASIRWPCFIDSALEQRKINLRMQELPATAGG